MANVNALLSLWHRLGRFLRLALRDNEEDFTRGPIGRAVGLLAIPMMLEMFMESIFAIVDIFFVGRLGEYALATVGLTELNLGIIPGWGGTQRLTRLVGRTKALEMILFSKRLGAAEALSVRLVNSVVPAERLMAEAMAMGRFLAGRPPLAVKAVLAAIGAFDYQNMEAGLEAEEQGSAVVGRSRDREEGFAAFLEKREPVFTGE